MYQKTLLMIIMLSVLVGCGAQKTLNTTVNTTAQGYEQTKFEIVKSYDNSMNFLKKQYSAFSTSYQDLKNSVIENRYISYIIPDSIILENRKSFVTWSKKSRYNYKEIIATQMRKKKIDLKIDNLSLAQKLALLNDYFFEQEQERYLQDFQKSYPKPVFDKFLTDYENLKILNNYKLAVMNISENWKMELSQTEKKIATVSLETLYGDLIVKNIRYSPNEKKLFLDINSEFNNFQEKFSLSLDAQLAKEFHSNSSLLEPSVYFDIKEGSILLVGATISYKKQHFLAQKTEENYTEQTNIHFVTNDTQLDLGKVDIEYKVIAKNIKPPQWFFHIDANQGEIIGYGSGITQDQAKKFALKEISEQLEVTVRSESSYEKQMQGNYVSNSNKSTIKTETTAQKLKGTQTIKQEKKDNIWYTAVMYKKGE